MAKKGSVSSASLPSPSREGIERFLASPFTKGIGKTFARKIIERYGADVLSPDFPLQSALMDIPGLGSAKINEFIGSIDNLKISPRLIALLYSASLSDAEVEKIVRHYGKNLEAVLIKDPYDMVENVWKFSFFSADKIGKILNIPADDPRRLRGVILTAIKFYAEEGNMFATLEQTLHKASSISGASRQQILPEIDQLNSQGRIVRNNDALYLPVYYNAEQEASQKIRALLRAPLPEFTYVMPEYDMQGHKFSPTQKEAIHTALSHRVSIITGGPGTGKTNTLRGILKILMDAGKKTIICAPTGRAAQRAASLTGSEASTIHRLLGYSQGKGYFNKKIEADFLIIDEASMLEQVLFNHLLQAVGDNTRIILVGDTQQLPAIGAGNVLADMIDSGAVPVVTLSYNFRQQEGSLIAGTAESIRQGNLPGKQPGTDFVRIDEKSPADIIKRLYSLVSEEIPSYTGIKPHEIQIVTPQQEGPLGAKILNNNLQRLINPNSPGLKHGVKEFRLNDRVMQTLNSAERGVYNGETGIVTAIDDENKKIEVTFSDGRKSSYALREFKELTLSYATTVHKLQGSETDYMILILTSAHRPMLYRNLLYTGISRAKKLCVLMAEPEALQTAVQTTEKARRNSNFKNLL